MLLKAALGSVEDVVDDVDHLTRLVGNEQGVVVHPNPLRAGRWRIQAI